MTSLNNLDQLQILNRPLVSPVPSMDHLLLMLRDNTLNWFAFVAELRMLLRNYSEETLVYALTEFSDHLENMDLTDKEKNKVEMSRQAYLEYERQKAMVDDAWVSESDSDTVDPDSVVTADLNEQVKIQRQKIKRKEKRQLARLKAERRLLKRKVPKRVSQIVNKFPNIGKDIEEFVRSNKVGADAWRRTGVLTFDGNTKSHLSENTKTLAGKVSNKDMLWNCSTALHCKKQAQDISKKV